MHGLPQLGHEKDRSSAGQGAGEQSAGIRHEFSVEHDREELIQEYGIPMPDLGLSQDQARAILEYFRSVK
jgi:hypothetical protein